MNKLLQIDCMKYMKDIPDKYFDLTLTDPPYNVGFKYNTHNDKMKDYYEWCNLWFDELSRISKRIVITVGMVNIKYWINKDPLWIVSWIKSNQCSPSRLGGFNAWEPIFVFGKDNKRIGQDIIIEPIYLQSDASFHSCPKPLRAWTKILKIFSKPGYKIFDPFSGSGTTRIACYDLGLDSTNCELDADYCRDNEARFQKHIQQQDLFTPKEIQKNIYSQEDLFE